MSAQVIFINTLYWPDPEERARLENLQEYLTFANIQYENERKRDFDIGLKHQVHKQARMRLYIVKAVMGELVPEIEP